MVPTSGSVNSESRAQALAAASQCFSRYGIRKTSMNDVADAAGISRPALYRLFSDRQALITAVMAARVEELIDTVLPRALECATLAESVVEASVQAIAFIRQTPDLYRLFGETTIGRASLDLLGTNSGGLLLGSRVWTPLLDGGRARGEVREGFDDDDFIEWVSTLILVYSERHDLTLDRLRSLFMKNLAPVVAPYSTPQRSNQ